MLRRILGGLYSRPFSVSTLAMDLCILSVQVLHGPIAIIADRLS